MITTNINVYFSEEAGEGGYALFSAQEGDVMSRDVRARLYAVRGGSAEAVALERRTVTIMYEYAGAGGAPLKTPEYACEISGANEARFTLPVAPLARRGTVRCQLRVYGAGGAVLCSAVFRVRVLSSIVPGTGEDASVPILARLISEAGEIVATEAMRRAAESERAEGEAGRLNAETARAAAERGREGAEGIRVEAERVRASAEVIRAENEAGRQALYAEEMEAVTRATHSANAAARAAYLSDPAQEWALSLMEDGGVAITYTGEGGAGE